MLDTWWAPFCINNRLHTPWHALVKRFEVSRVLERFFSALQLTMSTWQCMFFALSLLYDQSDSMGFRSRLFPGHQWKSLMLCFVCHCLVVAAHCARAPTIIKLIAIFLPLSFRVAILFQLLFLNTLTKKNGVGAIGSESVALIFESHQFWYKFFVACTQLYDLLCPFVGRLVGQLVGWLVCWSVGLLVYHALLFYIFLCHF